jgi:uncharacterized protein YjlB
VRFGGDKGKIVELPAGAVVILPAGTGHERLSASRDLVRACPTPGSNETGATSGTSATRRR